MTLKTSRQTYGSFLGESVIRNKVENIVTKGEMLFKSILFFCQIYLKNLSAVNVLKYVYMWE